MTTLSFFVEWAVRSAIVVLTAALLLKALRVQDPAFRLAAWTVVLLGSLLMPALNPVLPRLDVPIWRTPAVTVAPPTVTGTLPARQVGPSPRLVPTGQEACPTCSAPTPRNWTGVALLVYLLGAGALLLRLFTGLLLSRRLLARSRPTGLHLRAGSPVHESADLTAPATLGILRPVVVLPSDWREWEHSRLETILAHEQSHISRRDPALQLLSAIHRALLWYSPSSWFLHRQIVRLAEEASDDAALAAAGDRASYAEVLLHFIERAVEPVRWEGVAMARYGRPDDRIHRILDGTRISRGVTRFGWLTILTLAAPMVYVAAAVHPMPRPIAPAAAYLPAVAMASPSPTAASTAEAASPAVAAEEQSTSAAPAAGTVPGAPEAQVTARSSRSEKSWPMNRYIIFSADSASGTWDSLDHLPIQEWRARYGPDFAWFRHDETDYIVTDQAVLDELNRAMAPQREVDRMQDVVNRMQDVVNGMQSEVNKLQGDVNRQQDEVNRQQGEVNGRQRDGYTDQAGQSRVNAMQSDVNDQQQIVNREQGKVNDEQAKVNKEQRKVSREQVRVTPGIEMAIHDILDATVSKGLARPIQVR